MGNPVFQNQRGARQPALAAALDGAKTRHRAHMTRVQNRAIHANGSVEHHRMHVKQGRGDTDGGARQTRSQVARVKTNDSCTHRQDAASRDGIARWRDEHENAAATTNCSGFHVLVHAPGLIDPKEHHACKQATQENRA
jgi:hypothetical protein